MQFDSCQNEKTNFETLDAKFMAAGYRRPQLVFWNLSLSTSHEEFPVSADESEVVFLSGFSPSILSSIIDSPEELSPWSVIKRTVFEAPRYSRVSLPK